MESVILYCFACVFRLSLSDELVIDSYAVVGQRFSMAVIDALADLQKPQVILHSFLVLFDVIIEHADGIIRPPLVSYFSCPPTSKRKHLVILEPPHDGHIS